MLGVTVKYGTPASVIGLFSLGTSSHSLFTSAMPFCNCAAASSMSANCREVGAAEYPSIVPSNRAIFCVTGGGV